MRPACVMALAALALAASAAAAPPGPQDAPPPRELRVCADPNNLPFSNEREEGFENRIAGLVAGELGAKLRYTWMPQRRGFIRRTLNARQCDVVMGLPSEYELVLPTRPYYRSTYVFVYAKGRPPLRSFDDPALRGLKIGLQAIGDDGFNTPPAHALAKRGLVTGIVGYDLSDADERTNPPGRIIDAVAGGQIDAAVVWGPFGGYFAKRQSQALEVTPVDAPADTALPFAFDISMGVRKGDTGLKAELEGVLDRRKDDIRRILEEYGLPLVEPAMASAPAAGAARLNE